MFIFKRQPLTMTEDKGEKIEIKELIPITLDLAETSKEIYNATKGIEESAQLLNESSKGIVDFVRINTENINVVEREMRSIYQNAERINTESQENKQLSVQNAKYVEEGNQKIMEAVGQIETLMISYESTFEVLKRLDEYSKKIVNITNYMDQIANKTSMLSLNAGIEAVRAGEAGRGFMVITEEIKGLAEQSQRFSSEIEGMIGSITSCIQEIEASSKASYDKVTQTKETVNEMKNVLEEIVGCSKELDKNLDDTLTSSKQIGISVEEGKEKVHTLNHSFKETSHKIYEMLEAINKEEKMVKQLTKVSERITNLSDKQVDMALDKKIEEKVLGIGKEIRDYTGPKTEEALKALVRKLNIEGIYYANREGVFVKSSNKEAIGLNIYELDKDRKAFMQSKEEMKIFPISRNYETGELMKYLAIKSKEDKTLISVGFYLKTLIG